MNMQVYDKKHLVQYQDLGLYKGHINITPPAMAGHPTLEWTGAPIDRDTFRLALAFLKWTHDEHKCEGQARFWYNPETYEWRTVVLPQEKHGPAHTREVEEENDTKEEIMKKLMAEGFGEAGTIHHHSNMSAFQSGGDLADELSRPGFHVTVGNMSQKVADFHARATFKGINYEQEKGMMKTGQWLPGLRTKKDGKEVYKAIEPEIAHFWLSLEDLPEFPEVWKSYVVEVQRASTHTTGSRGSHQTGYWHQQHHRSHGAGTGYGAHQGRSRSEINKDLHRHDTPVYKSNTITVWLKFPDPEFRINVRLPKKQRDAIAASQAASEAAQTAKSEQDQKGISDGPVKFSFQELREMREMSTTEFNNYLKILREENRIEAEGTRSELEEKIADELAEFRDEHVSDHMSELGLNEMFTSLGQLSARVIRMIELTSSDLKSGTAPNKAEYRDLMLVWLNRLTELAYDLHEEEWEEMTEASKAHNPDDHLDYFELMGAGITAAQDAGTVEDVYFPTGEVIEMMRSTPEQDQLKRMKDIRR